MITSRKKKTASVRITGKRAPSLGRSLVTGAAVLKPTAKSASISLNDVRRVVRALKPLVLD